MSRQIEASSAGALLDEPQPNLNDRITFSFGRNWQDFVERYLNAERETIAIASLVDFLQQKDLKNLNFLDIGCGSGLFSLAAYRLGAKRIVSLDVDPFSVKCTAHLRAAVGSPQNWSVVQGSILEKDCVERLERADIVYAWGSLHHTGEMWNAIRNACELVSANGRFYLAIYNKVDGRNGSEFWLKVKKLYNRVSTLAKRLLEVAFIGRYLVLSELIRFRNPFAYWKNYSKRRGMNPYTDARDWLGGYPYEFASVDEIVRFCQAEMGVRLVNLRAVNNLGVNEFLFQR